MRKRLGRVDTEFHRPLPPSKAGQLRKPLQTVESVEIEICKESLDSNLKTHTGRILCCIVQLRPYREHAPFLQLLAAGQVSLEAGSSAAGEDRSFFVSPHWSRAQDKWERGQRQLPFTPGKRRPVV